MKPQSSRQRLRSSLTLLDTLRSYQRAWFGRDLAAGLSVCLVMIPSVIAYAE
ncbi:MAG: hypothetical protein RL710_3260, partial [Pseudomonadota bacterium]